MAAAAHKEYHQCQKQLPAYTTAHQSTELSFVLDCIDPMSIVGECASALDCLRIFRCRGFAPECRTRATHKRERPPRSEQKILFAGWF
jgi:hypothetical protein